MSEGFPRRLFEVQGKAHNVESSSWLYSESSVARKGHAMGKSHEKLGNIRTLKKDETGNSSEGLIGAGVWPPFAKTPKGKSKERVLMSANHVLMNISHHSGVVIGKLKPGGPRRYYQRHKNQPRDQQTIAPWGILPSPNPRVGGTFGLQGGHLVLGLKPCPDGCAGQCHWYLAGPCPYSWLDK